MSYPSKRRVRASHTIRTCRQSTADLHREVLPMPVLQTVQRALSRPRDQEQSPYHGDDEGMPSSAMRRSPRGLGPRNRVDNLSVNTGAYSCTQNEWFAR